MEVNWEIKLAIISQAGTKLINLLTQIDSDMAPRRVTSLIARLVNLNWVITSRTNYLRECTRRVCRPHR